jgi:hypothetical protein
MNKTADIKAYRKQHYESNKEKYLTRGKQYRAQNKEHLAELDKQYRMNNPALALYNSAKHRAGLKGIEFTITVDDILIPSECPILKVPFEYGTEYAMSLDRRDNFKGYVPGNVWVISKKANSMKSNATPDELRKFAQWVVFDV